MKNFLKEIIIKELIRLAIELLKNIIRSILKKRK